MSGTATAEHTSKARRPVIGFAGLGKMGAPMATNLINAGHEIYVYNRTYSKAEALAKLGAHAVHNIDELHHVDVLFSMLENDESVRQCIVQSNLLSRMQSTKSQQTTESTETSLPHSTNATESSKKNNNTANTLTTSFYKKPIHVCCSTLSAKFVIELTELHATHDIEFVCMPVIGRPDAAVLAQLHLLFGGSDEVQPLISSIVVPTLGVALHKYGTQPVQAIVMKIMINFVIGSTIETISEGAALVQKCGIAPSAFVDLLTSSLFDCKAYKNYGNMIAERRFYPPGANMEIGLKDVCLALQLSEEVKAPLPFASIMKDTLLESITNGMGKWDWAAVALQAEQHAGIHRKDKIEISDTDEDVVTANSNDDKKKEVK